jgi:branched-chain amino acid transport system ATP-binding protein
MTAITGRLLEVQGLSARYGYVEALRLVDLHVDKGELVAVLGPNGAGKSTLMRALLGVLPTSGRVRFAGLDVPRGNPAAAAASGMILVPEGRGIFGTMSVAENLELGAYLLKHDRAEHAKRLARALSLFPRLKERMSQVAGSLSGGEQQMLAIGRALMAGPKILLLDEPSLGLAPRMIEEILEKLGELNRDGLPIVLVEQKAPLALKLARRAYLMALGSIAAEIDPRTVKSHDELAHFYLG